WNLGDGSMGSGASLEHIYPAEGVYTAVVTASNSINSLTTATSITIYQPATADFTAVPLTGTAPLTVSFTNASVNAASYLWQFGDGSTSTQISPVHVYTQTGVYTVTLTAYGTVGLPSVLDRNHYITVTNSSSLFWQQTTSVDWQSDELTNTRVIETVADACIELDAKRTFTEMTQFNVFGNRDSSSLGVGDLDNDDDLDVIVGNRNLVDGNPQIPNELYWNNGDGTFIAVEMFNDDSEPDDIIIVDLDNDGWQDVFIGNALGIYNAVYWNNGDATFTWQQLANTPVGTPYFTHRVVAVDFNNDGFLDILEGNQGVEPYILWNNGNRTFTYDAQLGTPNGTLWGIGAGDLNSDGWPEALVAEMGPNAEETIFWNNQDGTFTADYQLGNLGLGHGFAVGDLDGDDDNDLFLNIAGPDDYRALNNGDGSFSLIGVGGIGTYMTHMADMDNDSDNDIIVVNYLAAVPNYLFWNDDGSGQNWSQYTFNLQTTSGLAIGDFNGDNALDMINANFAYQSATNENRNYWNEGLYEVGSVTVSAPGIDPAALYPDQSALLSWGDLTVAATIPTGADITYDILDSQGVIITGFAGLRPDAASKISLAGIDVNAYPQIWLRANLSRAQDEILGTPSLCSWTVAFQMEGEEMLPPQAGFSATPLSGSSPLTVTFTNASTGADSYVWQFGDGATSTEINPTHAYTQTGIYTVSLTASG
ncbi:MAG: PKD domain-containing protein, partial [Chloroflexi bacterium]|nr:PKD domain-containing protein [Chloroflexota bacterium]